MPNMVYTGIGSRETPPGIIPLMTEMAVYLYERGYRGRSGGAPGADVAFELGMGERKDIFLPWPLFNDNTSLLHTPKHEALALAESLMPRWVTMGRGVKLLMARNMYQVLGLDLNSPTDFIICYTYDGRASGGTGTAIRLAEAHGIPVYNLFRKDLQNMEWLKELVPA